MRDYTPQENGDATGHSEKKKEGMFISHGTAFVLLLLAICLAVLVGLVVHFASPAQLVCTCEDSKTETPTISPEELKGRCVEIVKGGDQEICNSCPKDTSTTMMMTTMMKTTPTTMMKTTPTTTQTMVMTTTTPAPKINYRLPGAVKPFHYVLELQPEIYGTNSSLFTFNGSVAITINVTESTSNITLHKKDINISSDSLTLKALDNLSNRAPDIVNTSYDEVREFYILHLDGDLDPGRSYEMGMTFYGMMRNDGAGLYTSSYTDDNNQTVYLASTQFEAPEARKAFPCFDEPAQKATFDITLVRKTTTGRNYRSLTNTDPISQEQRGEYTADKFARTPIMPTYLLAFIVCDFDQLENRTSNITYRTLARPNAIQFADRAHQYGLAIFDWFEKNFDPDFPISKLDNIAIPSFVSGAMENWGLITYRETILYEPGVSTASADSWTVEVVAHEIAHQWFGNIVSPKWWWYLWLNEAFASFWDYTAVESIYPERRSTEQFIVQSMHWAMVADGVRTSHPMTNDAESVKEVDSIFDTITYSKGGSIIRMMHFIMGNDLFIRGLNLYLRRHQYSVAEHQDLWNALTEQSIAEGAPINMTDIMDPWVTQMNYPVLTVQVVIAGGILVKQERFLNDMNQNTTGDTAPYNYRWTIPITIATSSDMSNFNKTYNYNEIKWIHHSQTQKYISDPIIPAPSVPDSWVVVNVKEAGFYRVNYDEQNWMALIKHLEMNHTDFPAVQRAQIINDAWALQSAGLVKMEVALRTYNFLKHETDYVPWRAFARDIYYLNEMMERSDLYGAFKEFMRLSLQKTYNQYRMDIQEDTLPITIFQTARGSNYACKYGVTECAADALRLFRAWKNDSVNNRLDPNLIGTIMCNAVRYGGMAEWTFAYDQYWNSKQSVIRSNSLLAMSCNTQPWLTERMLNMALDKTKIQSSNARLLMSYIAADPTSNQIVWNFIKENYALIAEKFSNSSISTLIADVAYGHSSEYFHQELQSFAKMTAAVGSYTAPLNTAIKNTKTNMEWMEKNHDIIKDWLVEQGLADYLP